MYAKVLFIAIAVTSLPIAFSQSVPPPTGIPALVTNLPFTAQEWTTITSVRPDGTTFKVARRTDIARDSAGSLRRDARRLTHSNPTGQPVGSDFVNIRDVPNHRSIILHPANNTAAIIPLKPSAAPQTLPVAIPFGAVVSSPNQYLGMQSIAGYTATGSRLSLRFPAGTRSPTQDVTETRDTWYSPDLKTVLLAETKDSLGNSTSTALSQIVLSEPDPSLFTIPANYAVTTLPTPVPGKPAVLSSGPQSTAVASSQQPAAIPLSHLYMHFFLYEAHLEHVADSHPDPEVPKGGAIKDHVRKTAGLSEAEWQSVSATSLRMETTLKAINDQATALVDADRKTCQSNKLSCLPAPPNAPQVRQLQQQRDQAIAAEIAALETALGPDSTAKLHAYLQSDLASHIRVITVSPAAIKAEHQAAQQAGQAPVQAVGQ